VPGKGGRRRGSRWIKAKSQLEETQKTLALGPVLRNVFQNWGKGRAWEQRWNKVFVGAYCPAPCEVDGGAKCGLWFGGGVRQQIVVRECKSIYGNENLIGTRKK